MTFICRQLGYTKQAHYKSRKQQSEKRLNSEVVKQKVLGIRTQMPRLGTRKLHYLLHHQQCFIGRDALFCLLRAEGLLVKKNRRYQKTTDSSQWLRRYKDLSKEVELIRPEQLWVADIKNHQDYNAS